MNSKQQVTPKSQGEVQSNSMHQFGNQSEGQILDNLSRVLLINYARGVFLTWSQVYNLTGVMPTKLTSLIDTYYIHAANDNLTTDIDPSWALTQSAKNYSKAYFDRDLLHVGMQKFSAPENFRLVYNEYGVGLKIVADAMQPTWYFYSRYKSWLSLQMFVCRFAPAVYAVPGVKSVELIGSASMRSATPRSDLDIALHVSPGFVFSSRLWIKFVLLKLTGRDVHVFWVELLLWLNSLLSQWNYYRDHLFIRIQSHLTQYLISHKTPSNKKKVAYKDLKTKIDLGIIYDNEELLRQAYGVEHRQSLWLWQRGLVCTNQSQVIDAIKSGHSHIIYNYRPPSFIKTFKSIVQNVLTYCFWSLLYPLSWIERGYYLTRQKRSDNFIAEDHLIGFVPRIYKQGYFTRIERNLFRDQEF